jgi:hypothetical protein
MFNSSDGTGFLTEAPVKEVAHGRKEEGDQQGQEKGPCEEEGRQEEEVAL